MSNHRKITKLSFLIIALALVATACGGGGAAATPDENGVIVIDLDESSISPSSIKVKVGDTVTIRLNNTGSKSHEWMVGRDVDTDEGFPNGFHDNFFADMMGLEVMPMDAAMGMPDMDMDSTDTTMAGMDDEMGHGFMIMREPGEQASITFTITADQVGEWEMACFEEDGAHYDDGMKGKFTVEA